MNRGLVASLAVALASGSAAAEPARLALVPLEPLGLDAERALRLEALFRAELERLAGAPLPARAAVDAATAALGGCGGEPACLAAVGRKLRVGKVVAGNIGELGDSYVVNLKLIDVERAAEERRVSERLRGSSDDLIEAVRVSAYRLVAPDDVRGALAVLSDVRGAEVFVDDKPVGRTPLGRPLAGLAVGPHALRLEAPGFTPFATQIDVHFQKTSEVLVRLADGAIGAPAPPPRGRPWTASPWTWAAVGVSAAVVGFLVGRALVSDHVVDCRSRPERCQ